MYNILFMDQKEKKEEKNMKKSSIQYKITSWQETKHVWHERWRLNVI